jgi:hypothetical protein
VFRQLQSWAYAAGCCAAYHDGGMTVFVVQLLPMYVLLQVYIKGKFRIGA